MKKVETARKSYAAEIHTRVTEISELLLQGLYRKDIIRYGTKWGVKNRTIEKYMAMANKLIKNQAIKDFEYNYSKVQKRYDTLYFKALQNEDYNLAKGINIEYAKLTGVNEPEKIETIETKKIKILPPKKKAK